MAKEERKPHRVRGMEIHEIRVEGGLEGLLEHLRGGHKVEQVGIRLQDLEKWAKEAGWLECHTASTGKQARITFLTPQGGVIHAFVNVGMVHELETQEAGHLENILKCVEMLATEKAMAAMTALTRQMEGKDEDEEEGNEG